MAARGIVLLVGILFHCVYLRSIFDIYFKSPVVQVNEQFAILDDEIYTHREYKAPAERLFLIVGDGLRADKLFENPKLAPFLHEKALHDGRWGISHTRVPTESRPGHVALIAGLYEDVSAVTTGWQLNPVNFDSVFNQSRQTYSWGSPDILPMFREGASDKAHVCCNMYDSHAEDFTGASDKLDTWVFERVEALLNSASANDTLLQELTLPKTVYFLHLLGLDTAGHANRPYSPEYLGNIATVDAGISNLMRKLSSTFGEEVFAKSAFLFTADHGMSDWGSHGDGHPDNTRTPYIAWGAGIRKPSSRSSKTSSTSLERHNTAKETLGWSVEANERIDVAQADLAALMSYIIGVPFPKNNAGSLPVELLTADEEEQSIAIFTNAKQIYAQYRAKASYRANQMHFSSMLEYTFSKDFPGAIQHAISLSHWSEVKLQSEQWILESLQGMKYLQRYDWLFLRSVITLGYLGWMLYTLVFVFEDYLGDTSDLTIPSENTPSMNGEHIPQDTIFMALAALCLAFLLEKSAPISYYAYTAFPLFFWYKVSTRYNQAVILIRRTSFVISDSLRASVTIALGLAIIQGIGWAYTDRRYISLMFPVASITPFFYSLQTHQKHTYLVVRWIACCCLMSIFTLLPTVQVESIYPVTLGGLLMTGVGLAYVCIAPDGSSLVLGAQTGLVALTTVVTYSSSLAIARKTGLPYGNQLTGWLALFSSLLLPLLHRFERTKQLIGYQERLMILFLTFAPTFVLLSVSYEGLFYIAFWALLVTWIELEALVSATTVLPPTCSREVVASTAAATAARNTTQSTDERPKPPLEQLSNESSLTLSDARRAFFFFFLINAAFFGTGNIASVSSFSLDSVYRLIPIFNPFLMGLLLLYKLLVPYIVISACLGTLNRVLRKRKSTLTMIVLSFCDLLTLSFFWKVKDEGSWLEIGSSISAFVIAGLLVLFVVGLEYVSELLVGDVIVP